MKELDKEIRDRFASDELTYEDGRMVRLIKGTFPELMVFFLEAMAAQKSSFLTMLPPEKNTDKIENDYDMGEARGWNDYRREVEKLLKQ